MDKKSLRFHITRCTWHILLRSCRKSPEDRGISIAMLLGRHDWNCNVSAFSKSQSFRDAKKWTHHLQSVFSKHNSVEKQIQRTTMMNEQHKNGIITIRDKLDPLNHTFSRLKISQKSNNQTARQRGRTEANYISKASAILRFLLSCKNWQEGEVKPMSKASGSGNAISKNSSLRFTPHMRDM